MKPARILHITVRLVPLAALWIGVLLAAGPKANASVGFLTPDVEEITTQAGFCATCVGGAPRAEGSNHRKMLAKARQAQRAAAPEDDALAPQPVASTATRSFDEKIGLLAYEEATRGRRMARFRGGGWMSGNRSKSMCASVVKDVLLKMKVCESRPGGNAYELAGASQLIRHCSSVKKVNSNRLSSAPKNSVIVYSGYAGNRPHKFGHVEMKLQVTPALKRRMARDSYVNKVPVGGYIYCSDYCRSIPTQSRRGTNPVAAIYEMK